MPLKVLLLIIMAVVDNGVVILGHAAAAPLLHQQLHHLSALHVALVPHLFVLLCLTTAVATARLTAAAAAVVTFGGQEALQPLGNSLGSNTRCRLLSSRQMEEAEANVGVIV